MDILVLYALRLSLEKRIHGILKTDFVKTSSDKPLGLSDLITIARNLDNISYSEGIKWNQIELVNKWLNHHIHRTLRPYPWIINQAIKVMEEHLVPKQFEDGNLKVFNFYGSTITTDPEALQNEIKLKIQEKFPNAKIKWADRHEVAKVNDTNPRYLK